MEVMPTAAVPWEPTPVNTRGGRVSRKYLREGELLPGVGFYARLVKYHEGEGVFTAPRHKHNYDQIRYTISGIQDFGQGQVARDHWPSFFPSGAPYGPERIEGAEVIVIQWGDEWVDQKQNDDAVAEMKKTGSFEHGIYSYVDDNGGHHNRDSIQAIWETVYGRPLVWPTPRYPQPILMNPDAFAWRRLTDELSIKPLGSFTERDIAMSVIRWDDAAHIQFGPERTQLLFSLKGEIDTGDQLYPAQTAVWSSFKETDRLEGQPGAEAVVFQFPRSAAPAAAAAPTF
jgi:hypothetical protein